MYLLTQRNTDFKLHSIWPRHLLGLFWVTVSLFISMDIFHCAILRWYLDERKVMFLGLVTVEVTRLGMAKCLCDHLVIIPVTSFTGGHGPKKPPSSFSVHSLSLYLSILSLDIFNNSLFSHRAMEHSLKLNEHCPPPTLPNRAVSPMCYIQMNLAFSVPMGMFLSLKWQVTHLNLLPSFSPLPIIHQEHLGRSPTSRLSDSSSPTVSTVPSSCHSPPPIIPGNVIYREGDHESHQHSYKTLLLL